MEPRQLLSGAVGLAQVAPTPLTVTAGLSTRSDPNDNGIIIRPVATIVGQTAPGARVRLLQELPGRGPRVTIANARGEYRFHLLLPKGDDECRIVAIDRGGQSATTSLTITRGDVIIDWNTTALDAIRAGRTNPPEAARNLAIVQLAVFGAVNAIDRAYEPYEGVQVQAPRGASPVAAAAAAADQVLRILYPEQVATFDASLAESLATVPRPLAGARGVAVGREAAAAILALRADDGAGAYVDAPVATEPGMWIRTPPAFSRPVGLNFAYVTPFALADPAQFRPGPPPALDGVEYAEDYAEVKAVGVRDSTERTPDQTAYAHFWADLPGVTFTPPGHWNQIAQDAAMSERLSLTEGAHTFALLNIALADAGISCWEAKNYYNLWRPVSAIRAGDTDGNPLTEADPDWTPQWDSPAFSSYTSGHATFSGAAATVLTGVFGPDFAFDDTGDASQGLATRRFTSFEQAAAEAAASRLYGGIHYRFDNEVGLVAGNQVGRYVLQNQLLPRTPGR